MTTNREREAQLENELDELDIPIITLSDAILVIADAIGHPDPLDFFNAMLGGADEDIDRDERIARGLTDHALESVTQLEHVRRALEIANELSTLAAD